jgi:hypothetical protein
MVSADRFINDFSRELDARNAAIFAGAGLSVAAGFVNWKDLLRRLAQDIELDVDREHDLVTLAQFHVNHHGNNRDDLNDVILNQFSRREAVVTENHRILARLPITTYWTTNYDTAIEDSLITGGKTPDVKHSPAHLMQTLRGRDAVVYKMHGDVGTPSEAVLCKEDYERYQHNRGDFLTALAGDLLSKTFLFLGFSFSDPNLDYVLSRLHSRHNENMRKHFCILRKEAALPTDADGDLAYRTAKQKLFVRDLQRYNIRAVMVNEYADITEILRRVESRFKSNTVFASGAAHTFDSALPEKDALYFVHELSKQLIGNNFRIVTGLGLGIGSTVVDGALQQIYRVQRRTLAEQLVIRPFPQSLQGKQLWNQYRQEMLDFAGLAIFMFGNKFDDATASVIASDGIIEEFDIAHSKGIKVLPLGFTEFVARSLWTRVKADFSSYYPHATPRFEQLFDQLGDSTLTVNEHLSATIEALTELQRM